MPPGDFARPRKTGVMLPGMLPPQRVADGKIVSIHYVLTSDEGEVLDKSGATPLPYLHGAGNIVPGLERGLSGHGIGDQVKVDVPPQEAYGHHDPEGIQQVPRAAFPEDIELQAGMQFEAHNEAGEAMPIWISEVAGETIMVDFNHPLAGETLHFDVTIADIRDATAEEREHGHPHGPGCHHH